jgi:hypothetical protein
VEDTQALVPAERVEAMILILRGEKVILDADIAVLYGVETKGSHSGRQEERRPLPRRLPHPADPGRAPDLEITICDLKLGRPPPPALRLHGAGRRDAVERAAQRAGGEGQRRGHARLRPAPAPDERPSGACRKLETLEQRYDKQFKVVFDALRELMMPPDAGGGTPIGFN